MLFPVFVLFFGLGQIEIVMLRTLCARGQCRVFWSTKRRRGHGQTLK